MRKSHQWNDQTEDGVKRAVRAERHGLEWQVRTKLKGDAYWSRCEPISIDLLEALLDVLERKYQRKRAPYDDVLAIRKLLEEARVEQ